jgi:hypothetical protein
MFLHFDFIRDCPLLKRVNPTMGMAVVVLKQKP